MAVRTPAEEANLLAKLGDQYSGAGAAGTGALHHLPDLVPRHELDIVRLQ